MSEEESYSLEDAFREVIVENENDIHLMRTFFVKSYDLDLIQLSECDVDMIRVTGSPKMLSKTLDVSYLQCFGPFKPNKRLNGFHRIVQEPWQIWIRDIDVWNLYAVTRNYCNSYPIASADRKNPLHLTVRIHGHMLIDMLVEAGVQTVCAYQYSMKESNLERAAKSIKAFRDSDPQCEVLYDLGYYIQPMPVAEGVHTLLLSAMNTEGAMR